MCSRDLKRFAGLRIPGLMGCNVSYVKMEEMLKNIMPLLKRLQSSEYQPAASESKGIPRYQVKGMYGTKAMRMANVLDELARRYSMERNISQREMFEVALIELFMKYGYSDEVEKYLLD